MITEFNALNANDKGNSDNSDKGDKSDKDSDYTSAEWHKSELLECLYFVVGNEIFRRHLTQRF